MMIWRNSTAFSKGSKW